MQRSTNQRYRDSQTQYIQATKSIPGGVNSPVRAFGSVGGTPVFMKSAKGSQLTDIDGNEYIDFIASWGAMILGHGHPEVVEAINVQIEKAISFGAPTRGETNMAELIKEMVPNVELIRLVNSGTEACMSALRLARGYSAKNKLLKFEGNYHGHADALLAQAGSGLATLDIQSAPGVTKGTAQDTLVAPYNDPDAVKALFQKYPDEIAAVMIEPVAGNMGCVVPDEAFIKGLRELCTQYGSVLIFDEVMTGFRLKKGGAQALFGIEADLVCYGKVIGGGMPIGAFGGKKEIMECIAPVGEVYQAGTLSGNPLSVAAGYATLKTLNRRPEIYERLSEKGATLKKEIGIQLSKKNIAHTINQCGSMISVHFGVNRVKNFTDAARADAGLFSKFFHHMLAHGIYLPPSPFESWFFGISLTDTQIDRTIDAISRFNN